MPPKDPTPLGDELVHRMPEPKFPQPKPGHESAEPVRGRPAADDADIADRPALPEHPERTAADIEDEKADPVIDTGAGIGNGPTSLKKQRAGMPEIPAPESVPPVDNPDPQPNDPKPKTPPPPEDEPGRRVVPVELPGKPHPPERV